MSADERQGTVPARLIGRGLRAGFRTLLVLRRPRPIHAHGRVLHGRITWTAASPNSGIEWIDAPAGTQVDVVGRLSRSVGLPAALPDIIGLALRVDNDGAPANIELASTGRGVPARFLLLPHRSPSHAWFGSLLPYRSPVRGGILLAARPDER